MLRIGPAFEKDSVFPVLGDDLVVNSCLPTCLFYPQTVSSPHHGVNSEDEQIFHWLQAGSKDPDDMADQKSAIGEIIGDDYGSWSEHFSSFTSDPSKAQLYALRSQSALQSQESLIHSARENPIRRMHSRLGDHTQDLSRSFTQCVTATNHVGPGPHGLAQPIPKPPGLFMMNQYLTPFASTKPESTAMTPLSMSDVVHDEPQADKNPLHGSIPASNPMVAGALFPRSAEESSIATADSDFTSIGSTCGPTTPLPWSSFTVQPVQPVQPQWDLQCQETTRNETWLNAPHVPNIPQMYGHSTPDVSPFTPNDIPHGLSEPGADPQQYTVPSISLDLSRPGYPLTGGEQDIDHQPSPFYLSSQSTCIDTSRQLNQYMVPTAAALGGDHHFQPERPEKTTPWHRDTKNAFLIEFKRFGLSYKDIKRIGGFKEAESTLRGRFRTLTKAKEQRVRKPQWLEKDIQLLCEAVATYAEPGKSSNGYAPWNRPRTVTQPPKVSWKKVAQYIWSHGGSYHFGNATCKRKWCEVHNVKE